MGDDLYSIISSADEWWPLFHFIHSWWPLICWATVVARPVWIQSAVCDCFHRILGLGRAFDWGGGGIGSQSAVDWRVVIMCIIWLYPFSLATPTPHISVSCFFSAVNLLWKIAVKVAVTFNCIIILNRVEKSLSSLFTIEGRERITLYREQIAIIALYKRVTSANHPFTKSDSLIALLLAKEQKTKRITRKTKERIPNPDKKTVFHYGFKITKFTLI